MSSRAPLFVLPVKPARARPRAKPVRAAVARSARAEIPLVMTVAQVADILGQHADTVYAAIRAGRLKAIDISLNPGPGSRSIRVLREDLRAYLRERKGMGR